MTMAEPRMNKTALMSGADYFEVVELNPYSHPGVIDQREAMTELEGIAATLRQAGIHIIKVDAPKNCQDGVFVANWAFCYQNIAIMSRLPGPRQGEEAYAETALKNQGKRIMKAPYRFSGQGDVLRCGKYVFVGTGGYRSDPKMAQFLAETFPDLIVVPVATVPELDAQGQPMINKLSGWPDSFFYDLDLAISILHEDLIGWCPEAVTPASQQRIRDLPIQKIEVSLDEAIHGLGCNLVSTGSTVIMGRKAPNYRVAIEKYGLKTITPETSELAKGGGGIRCTSLTLE